MWGGSEEWKPCDSNTTTLTIPSVQKSNEGSYRCVVRNCAGSQISNSAELEVRDSTCTVITAQIHAVTVTGAYHCINCALVHALYTCALYTCTLCTLVAHVVHVIVAPQSLTVIT